MRIDWWTLGLEAINFLVLVWLLQRFLYKPVMGVVAKRREQVDAALAEADDVRRRAEAEAAAYRDKVAAIEAERLDILRVARTRIDEEHAGMLAEARREADGLVAKGRRAIAAEREGALKELREGAADLAVSLAATLLSEAADGSIAETFLERLRQRYLKLTDTERARLFGADAEPAALRVVTQPPLSDSERARWRERLSATIGDRWAIEFDADPGLVAGARIHFPAASLEISWDGALKDAKKELAGDEPAA